MLSITSSVRHAGASWKERLERLGSLLSTWCPLSAFSTTPVASITVRQRIVCFGCLLKPAVDDCCAVHVALGKFPSPFRGPARLDRSFPSSNNAPKRSGWLMTDLPCHTHRHHNWLRLPVTAL